MAVDGKCITCKFWQEVVYEDGHRIGLCRRNAPMPKIDGDIKHLDQSGSYIDWPKTYADEWCGEYVKA